MPGTMLVRLFLLKSNSYNVDKEAMLELSKVYAHSYEFFSLSGCNSYTNLN